MTWNLFIDDERVPGDVKWAYWYGDQRFLPWTICRNKMQVISAVFDHDKTLPNFITFDHDLGRNEPTGYDIVKWMVEMTLDGVIKMPENFDFYVHSLNPIGKQNIEKYLINFLKSQGRR